MTATEALTRARCAGIHVGIDGDDLVLEASAPPPAEVLDLLVRFKADILALLRFGSDGWSGEDWQGFFDERVRFAESIGFQSDRAYAEARWGCVNRWIIRNPTHSRPGICAACGMREGLLQPYVTDHVNNDHTWLHPPCSTEWFEARRTLAASELAKLGVAMLGGES